MRLDNYTKSILTIIAIALVILVCQNFLTMKSATAAGSQRVVICKATGGKCVKFVAERTQYLDSININNSYEAKVWLF